MTKSKKYVQITSAINGEFTQYSHDWRAIWASDLPLSAKVLLRFIYEETWGRQNQNGGGLEREISLEEMMSGCNISRSTTIRSIKNLIDFGLIKRKKISGRGSQITYIYSIRYDEPTKIEINFTGFKKNPENSTGVKKKPATGVKKKPVRVSKRNPYGCQKETRTGVKKKPAYKEDEIQERKGKKGNTSRKLRLRGNCESSDLIEQTKKEDPENKPNNKIAHKSKIRNSENKSPKPSSNIQFKELTQKFRKIVTSAKNPDGTQKYFWSGQLAAQSKHLEKLAKDIGADKVKHAVEWYLAHFEWDGVPLIFNCKGFLDKYNQIVSAMGRLSGDNHRIRPKPKFDQNAKFTDLPTVLPNGDPIKDQEKFWRDSMGFSRAHTRFSEEEFLPIYVSVANEVCQFIEVAREVYLEAAKTAHRTITGQVWTKFQSAINHGGLLDLKTVVRLWFIRMKYQSPAFQAKKENYRFDPDVYMIEGDMSYDEQKSWTLFRKAILEAKGITNGKDSGEAG